MRHHRWPSRLSVVLGAAGAVIIVVVVAATILSARHRNQTLTPPRPLAKTPGPGYLLFTDMDAGFEIEYPQHWTPTAQHPGVEFDDDAADPDYIVQVLLPTVAQDPNTDWVTYELEQLRTNTGATSFTQQDGIAGRVIGGQQWNGGAATLLVGENTIDVQVFATVYQGKPYVVNLAAANGSIVQAQSEYFDAMLNSFAFLS